MKPLDRYYEWSLVLKQYKINISITNYGTWDALKKNWTSISYVKSNYLTIKWSELDIGINESIKRSQNAKDENF
jgi:hypothetical protein